MVAELQEDLIHQVAVKTVAQVVVVLIKMVIVVQVMQVDILQLKVLMVMFMVEVEHHNKVVIKIAVVKLLSVDKVLHLV